MNHIINLDYDFFFNPTYFGSYFAQKDWNSIEDFKAKSKPWITAQEFIDTLKIKQPLRGRSSIDNAQSVYSIKSMFDQGFLKKQETEMIMFDAHPNIYYWHPAGHVDYWSPNDFKPFNSSLFFFKENIFKQITWVPPKYVDDDILRQHFENFKIIKDGDKYTLYVSDKFGVKIKLLRWDDFCQHSGNYEWKFFNFILNSRMLNHSQEDLKVIMSYLKQY